MEQQILTKLKIFKEPKTAGQVVDILDSLSEYDQKLVTKLIEQHYNIKVNDLVAQQISQSSEYNYNEINWTDMPFYNDYYKVKGRLINVLKKCNTEENHNLLFIAHSHDKIIGKPQQIHETVQNIPIVIKTAKKGEDGKLDISYKFIDDRFDKRYDGYELASLEKKFYVYRVIDNDIEYMAFSEKKLDSEQYTLTGMKVRMPNLSELTKTLKVRSIATVFFIKEATSSIKVLPKEELVDFTKKLHDEIGLNQEAFRNLTFLHPDGKVYLRSEHYNLIRIAQLLSGKEEGYPLHILNLGPIGKGKTKELESLDCKFNELKGILEAGNSTPKVLIPSFKEKPASPGYILSTVRIALIDELMKMIANANINGRSGEMVQEHLSQLNMLLEHKKRTIGSGNDNSLIAKATSKCLFCANPLPGKGLIGEHIGIVDGSTLSRMLCVVQDEEEQKFIENNKPFPIAETLSFTGHICSSIYTYKNGGLYYCNDDSSNIYIQIYDSCQVFRCNFDIERVRTLFNISSQIAEEPMKSVWKARGLHHSVLLLDGLVKYRCLFKDFDKTFTANDYDYMLLEVLLHKIVNSWKVNLSLQDKAWRARFN